MVTHLVILSIQQGLTLVNSQEPVSHICCIYSNSDIVIKSAVARGCRYGFSWCPRKTAFQWTETFWDKKAQPFLVFISGLVRCDLVNDETITDLTKQFPRVFLSTVLTEMNEMCKRAGCIPFFKPWKHSFCYMSETRRLGRNALNWLSFIEVKNEAQLRVWENQRTRGRV